MPSFPFERGVLAWVVRRGGSDRRMCQAGPQLCVFKAHHGLRTMLSRVPVKCHRLCIKQSVISSVLLSEPPRTQQAKGTLLSRFVLCFETKAVSEMANVTLSTHGQHNTHSRDRQTHTYWRYIIDR